MATSKRPVAQELKTMFSTAADYEIKRREVRTAEDLAYARKQAAKERAEKKVADAKAREDARYEKKIIAIFKETKRIYDKAFGERGTFVATIKGNQLKIEHMGESQLAKPSPAFAIARDFEPTYLHGRFGKIITVKNGGLFQRRWGMAVDPQYRNYTLPMREDELRGALIGPIMAFGSKADLEKVKALQKPAAPAMTAQKKTTRAPKPR